MNRAGSAAPVGSEKQLLRNHTAGVAVRKLCSSRAEAVRTSIERSVSMMSGSSSSATSSFSLPAYAMPRPRMAPMRVWGSSLDT